MFLSTVKGVALAQFQSTRNYIEDLLPVLSQPLFTVVSIPIFLHAGRPDLVGYGLVAAVLLTTHDMAEAEALCDRVALIDQGRLLAVETPASLGRLIAQHERIDFEGGSEVLLNALRGHPGSARISTQPGNGEEQGFRLEVKESDAHRSVLQLLVSSGITSIRTSRPSLEEVYLHVIGDRGFAVKPELQNA